MSKLTALLKLYLTEKVLKIKRNNKQCELDGPLALHEAMLEADLNAKLFRPTDPMFMESVGEMVTRINEMNDIHDKGEFESLVEDACREHLFFLKLENQDNVVELHFENNEITITNSTANEVSALLEMAASLNAELLNEFGRLIPQPKSPKKSFWRLLGLK
ncbi:hypothetical protein ACRRS0_16750 [Agarivorans sp. QJM3NY_29]|uniref:hypothetical protein n=1 Tax=unclassified Agarivorans TaxID=2636026 RepID=UPI003D7E26DB